MKNSTKSTVIVLIIIVVLFIAYSNISSLHPQTSNSQNNGIITTTNQQKGSISGSMVFEGSYSSVTPSGESAEVYEIELNFTPSPLSFLEFDVQTQQGYSALLETTSYSNSPTWPSNQPEVTYTFNDNFSYNITAFTPFVYGTNGTEIQTGSILYLVGLNGVTLTGAQITMTASDYTGSVTYVIP